MTTSSSITCVATEVITSEHKPVGYCYRTAPVRADDSGWRFLTGHESQKYMNQPSHYITCALNEVVAANPALAAVLDAPAGSVFERASPDADFVAAAAD